MLSAYLTKRQQAPPHGVCLQKIPAGGQVWPGVGGAAGRVEQRRRRRRRRRRSGRVGRRSEEAAFVDARAERAPALFLAAVFAAVKHETDDDVSAANCPCFEDRSRGFLTLGTNCSLD